MRKKKNTKLADNLKSPAKNRAADLLVVVFCLTGMTVCLWLFRQDLYRTLSRLNVKPAGTVVLKRRIVQRRFENRALWDRLRKTALVYSGDFIRTEARSEAAITLIGGGTVTELGENTIIKIGEVRGTGESRIELFGGNVSLNAGSEGMVLVSGRNVLTLAAGGAVSADSVDGGFAFRVDGGTAVFTGSEGTEETFRAGESSGGEEWPPDRSEGTGPVEGGVIPVAAGTEALPTERPRLILPAEGEAFPYGGVPPEISFRWAASADEDLRYIDLYILEAADNPDMENAAVKIQVSGKRIALSRLERGRWYWRVTPVYAENSPARPPVLPSVTASFSIGETAPLSVAEAEAPDPGMAGQDVNGEPTVQTAAVEQTVRPSDPVERIQPALAGQSAAPAQSAVVPSAAENTVIEQSVAGEALVEQLAAVVQPALAERPAVPAQSAVEQSAVENIVVEQPAAVTQPQTPAITDEPAVEVPEPLPPPGGRRPEDGYVLGPAQLRTSRNITFSWDIVPGASVYVFSLYQETGGLRQLIDTVETRTPRYVFDKLNLLERGGFIWTVEAPQRTRDGTLIQGDRAESRFTVDIPRLQPRELPTGTLYGD